MGKPRQHCRLVISTLGRRLDMENSTCKRTLDVNGLLTEIVMLHGTREHLTDEELESFVRSFPIEAAASAAFR